MVGVKFNLEIDITQSVSMFEVTTNIFVHHIDDIEDDC
jgi:hypothetical protein